MFFSFFSGCSHKEKSIRPTRHVRHVYTSSPSYYHYPNYNIIKPKVICKPKRRNIKTLLSRHMGKPYVWAEEGPDAFDCSGLTYNIYGQMGIDIPRTASEQAKMGAHIPFSDLYYGDLIFFGSDNPEDGRITHVGIYLANGWFAEASSSKRKIKLTNFAQEPQYLRRVKACRRYLSKDERGKYTRCDAPIKKMKITDIYHTVPWKRGMPLPEKSIP